jgi:hypothetical protein
MSAICLPALVGASIVPIGYMKNAISDLKYEAQATGILHLTARFWNPPGDT